MFVFNMSTGAVLNFDGSTDPSYAVCYGYYVETENRASWFFDAVRNARDWSEEVTKDKRTIARGDWCAFHGNCHD